MPSVVTTNWWALALRGVLALLFGILMIALPLGGHPFDALALLAAVYGTYAFVDGLFALAAAGSGVSAGRPWGLLLLEGIIGVAIGVITFLWPPITVFALAYLVAFWAILTGVVEIAAAFRLRHHVPGGWALAVAGVLSVALGVLLCAWPLAGLLGVAMILGAYAIVWGVLLLALAFRLRSWGRGLTTLTAS